MKKRAYVYGNWKMNQSLEEIQAFVKETEGFDFGGAKAALFPQALHLGELSSKAQNIQIGAQNISEHTSGAYTGEISPLALKEMGITSCLVGHSERRSLYNEDLETIAGKVKNAINEGFQVILCIGETLEERKSGKIFDVLTEQVTTALKGFDAKNISQMMIAYEPVWAIGTGEVATPDQAEEAHSFIRELLSKTLGEEYREIPLLYGGSVKPGNFESLLAKENIDGGLVGGASLKAESFLALCEIAKRIIN